MVLKCWKGLVATQLVANMTCPIFEREPKVALTAAYQEAQTQVTRRFKILDFGFRFWIWILNFGFGIWVLIFGFFSDTLVAVTAASQEAQTQVTRRAPR